jgi:hypothetical protein
MAAMKGRVKVVKADGSEEDYLHTKVVGTICHALDGVGRADIHVAEELAEAVTYYLFGSRRERKIGSGEVFSIVQAVLAATGYEDAAAALSEHHYQRRMRRGRTEVIAARLAGVRDAGMMQSAIREGRRSRWDKSRIVADLVGEHGLGVQSARTIAGMVEEKIFGMQMTQVTTSLINQVVLSDAAAVLEAESQLQMV